MNTERTLVARVREMKDSLGSSLVNPVIVPEPVAGKARGALERMLRVGG